MNETYETYPDPAEIRHTIGATGQLTINNVSGHVELRAVDGGEVTVVARSQSGRSQWLPLTVRKSDGSLTVDVEKRGSFAMFGTWFGAHDGMDFDVSVPRAAWVMINTVSADVRARQLSGEQSYKTVSGNVALEPDGGKVRVVTVSGDAKVRATRPIELAVNTTSGDVEVEGAALNRLDARTVSGDLDFEADFAVGPVHTIETVSGDLTIDSTTGVTVDIKKSMDMRHGGSRGVVAGDGAAQVRFRTLSGDVRLQGSYELDEDGQRKRGRHGKHERFERQLERRIEQQVRRGLGGRPDDIDFPGGMPPMPPMPTMPPSGQMPPMPPMPPAGPGSSYGQSATATAAQRQPVDQLEILRALERGEIDVDEANRRLQEA